MNTFFKTTILSVLLVLLSAWAGAQQSSRVWTLEDCINHALENNIRLQQQRLSVDLAQEGLSQSRAGRYPSLNANASHNYNYGRRLDPLTNEFATESVRNNNFGISSGVNLFSGFQQRNIILRDRLELVATEYDVETAENDIALSVASGYVQILFTKELLEVASNQLEITRQQVERTRQLVDAGSIPLGNLLTIQAQEASEEVQLVNVQNQLSTAYLDLMQMLDIREDDQFEIEVPVIEIYGSDVMAYSPLQLYETASRVQPSVRSSDTRVESAEKSVDIARGARSPSLSLGASSGTGFSEARIRIVGAPEMRQELAGRTASLDEVFGQRMSNGPGLTTEVIPFREQLEDNLNHSIGFSLRIPIFNSFQVRSSVNRSRISLENARLNNQLVKDQLFKTIQQAHQDAATSLKRYNAMEKNVEALEESFRYTEQRFDVGMVNTLEYNDAKNRLTAVQSELVQARYEYVFRVKVLEFYIGSPISF